MSSKQLSRPWVRTAPLVDVEPSAPLPRKVAPPSPLVAMDRLSPKSAFIRARKAENNYARQLRRVAKHIEDLVGGVWSPSAPHASADTLRTALDRYAAMLEPWARSVGERMVTEVAARERRAWQAAAVHMGQALRAEIDGAATGAAMRAKMAEQVGLITSLPLEAAERVHRLVQEGITEGRRAADISAEILKTGHVTRSRANLIARTEVGRTATTLTQSRAESIGSEGYIWRTAQDSDVRPSHQQMQGKFVRWGEPPELDGMVGHAGALPNCRCYCEPVIPPLED
jgi:SPP1 gp7 family putative phage head morphogenesis protein